MSRVLEQMVGEDGKLRLSYHYALLMNQERVQFIEEGIKSALKEITDGGERPIFYESGFGSGIFLLHAASLGAECYGAEIDKKMYKIASEGIEKSPHKDNIHIIYGDITKVTLDDLKKLGLNELPNIALAENFSTGLCNEPFRRVANYLRKNILDKDCIWVTPIIKNNIQGVYQDYSFGFGPNFEAKLAGYEFRGMLKAKPITDIVTYEVIDPKKKINEEVDETVCLTAKTKGIITAMRITSPIKFHHGKIYHGKDYILMPPIVIPLQNPVEVNKGNQLKVRIRYKPELTDIANSEIYTERI